MKNWRTTLISFFIGALTILQAAITAYQSGTPVNWMQVTIGIALMGLGLVQKDAAVTGVGPTAKSAAQVAKIKADGAAKFGLVVMLASLAGLSQTSCTNFQQKINTVLEAESKLQAQERQIVMAAQLNVAFLPADKQAQALKLITDTDSSFNQAIVTKSATLQAINDGLNSDWVKLGQDITAAAAALEQLAKILLQFGADAGQVNAFVADVKATKVYTLSRIEK